MTDKDTHTPLPCPMCGSKDVKFEFSGEWQCYESGSLECDCGVSLHVDTDLRVPGANWKAELTQRWNTRAVNSHHDLIEALEALLNSSGARGVYHASKHFDAVEAAENLLAALKEAGR